MSSYNYPQGRESSHTHRPLADPASKLSYVVVSPGGVQKKVIDPAKDSEPVDLGLDRQEIIDSINERAAAHAHHHHHYHDEFGPESAAYHDGERHHAHEHGDAENHGHAHAHAHVPERETWVREDAKASNLQSEVPAPDKPADEAAATLSADDSSRRAPLEEGNAPSSPEPVSASAPQGGKKAVKAALKAAAVNMSAKKFAREWETRGNAGISQSGCFENPGCYAILRYPRSAKKAAQFSDVYVGGSRNMGNSVMRHLTGEGNPDVYADMKYGQDLRVLLYPYPEDAVRAKTFELIAMLGADQSYNKRS